MGKIELAPLAEKLTPKHCMSYMHVTYVHENTFIMLCLPTSDTPTFLRISVHNRYRILSTFIKTP